MVWEISIIQTKLMEVKHFCRTLYLQIHSKHRISFKYRVESNSFLLRENLKV